MRWLVNYSLNVYVEADNRDAAVQAAVNKMNQMEDAELLATMDPDPLDVVALDDNGDPIV